LLARRDEGRRLQVKCPRCKRISCLAELLHADHDELRCLCGRLMGRLGAAGHELRCTRCKCTLTVDSSLL
jgi:phage FluMu protein Com